MGLIATSPATSPPSAVTVFDWLQPRLSTFSETRYMTSANQERQDILEKNLFHYINLKRLGHSLAMVVSVSRFRAYESEKRTNISTLIRHVLTRARVLECTTGRV